MRFASLSTFLASAAFLAACASGGSRPGGDGGSRDLGREGPTGDMDIDLDKVDLGEMPDLGPPDLGCTSDTQCDDHVVCDGVETCVGGACTPGTPMACDDSVPCTNDTCLEPGTCQHTPDATMCVAPQLCDLTMGCVTPPACTSDAMCDDGLACDGLEHCVPSIGCQPGSAPSCDDGMSCTTDRCMEPSGTCSNTPQDADRDGFPLAGCAGGTDCNDLAGTVHPGAIDVCDSIDNDCDGAADNGAGLSCVQGSPPASCPTACGTTGSQTCNAACVLGPCLAAEACNNCDDDGDGTADNGFACRRGYVNACTTPCGTMGNQTCPSDCSGYPRCNASTETCGNSCDDDGDGMVDEGCAPTGPPNDLCGGAAGLLGASGSTSGTLAGATAQTTDCSVLGGVEVFYSINVAGASLIYLDTFGTGFDTKISYRGTSCPGSGTTCIDDTCSVLQSQIAIATASGGTFYFAVHTFSSSTVGGPFTLNWQVLPAAAGGNTAIAATGSFAGSTSGTNNSSALCGGGASGPEHSYYWMQCPGQVRTISANTCTASYDTVIHVSGPSGEIGCDDDGCISSPLRSQLSGATASGQGLYAMYVDGYAGASGTYTLSVTSF